MDSEDSLVLHAPPTADIDAEFNNEEPVAARPPSALAMLLLRLSLEERQGDSSLRSSAIIDNASQLLGLVADPGVVKDTDLFCEVKRRADKRRYPLPVESLISFLTSPSSASDQIARTAVSLIGIMILSSEQPTPGLDKALAEEVRKSLEKHLSKCQGKNGCEALATHVAIAFSSMVNQPWWPQSASSPSLASQLFNCGASNCKDMETCTPWLHRMCSSSHNFPNVISTKLLVVAGFGAKLLSHDLSDNLAEVDEDEDDDEMEVDGAAVAPLDGTTAPAASSTPLPPPTSSPATPSPAPTPGATLMRFPARLPVPSSTDLFTPRPHLREAFLSLPGYPSDRQSITWKEASRFFSEYIIGNRNRFFMDGDKLNAHIKGTPLAKAFHRDILHRKDAQQCILRNLIPVSPAGPAPPLPLASTPAVAPDPQPPSLSAPELPPPMTANDADSDQITCCACHDDLASPAATVLACGHALHLECASAWFQQANTCPICRDACNFTNAGLLPTNNSRRTMIFPSGATLTTDYAPTPATPHPGPALSPPPAPTLPFPPASRARTAPREAQPRPQSSPAAPSELSTAPPSPHLAQAFVTSMTEAARQPSRRPAGTLSNRFQSCSRRNGSFRSLVEKRLRVLERRRFNNRPYQVPQQRSTHQQHQPRAFFQTLQNFHFLQTVVQILMTMMAVLMASSIHQTKAAMIDEYSPEEHTDPSTVTSYRSNDILAFESYPRSISVGLTAEAVNLSTLADLRATLQVLESYATHLEGSIQVPLDQAETYCSPRGYHQTLTNVLSPGLKLPHFIKTKEFHNRPGKTYEAVLQGGPDSLHCNYSLTHLTIMSLASTLDSSSNYYHQNRRQKYLINSKWLVTAKGESCEAGRTLRRGEIIKEQADSVLTIPLEEGSIFSCGEACKNMARMKEQRLNSGCILSAPCGNDHNKGCRFYSFNWESSTCTLSSKRDVSLDTAWNDGFNSLTAPVDCLALPQHQSTSINVNGTMREMSTVCKFNPKGFPPTSFVYRSCPGTSAGLMADVLPLSTLLDTYMMSLDGNPKASTSANVSISSLSDPTQMPAAGANKRQTRSLVKMRRSSPAAMAILKPLLNKFISLGHSHLATSIGSKFISGAFPLTYLLLLVHSIIALTVSTATENYETTSSDPFVQLQSRPEQAYESWEIIESPNLLHLEATGGACRIDNQLLATSEKIPKLLHGLHQSLNRLLKPLHRLINDPEPATGKVRAILSSSGKNFGFWTVYNKQTAVLTRYYAYKIVGPPASAVKQVAVLGGSSLSPVKQGTLVQGGTPPAGAPSWTCVAVVSESNATSPSFTPKECYGAPRLSPQELFSSSFLPHADIYRVLGKHHLEYNCPKSSPGSILARGILIFVLGRECSLSMDNSIVRDPSQHDSSAWATPLVLVDKKSEFQPHKNAPFSPSLKYAVEQIANEAVAPSILDIKTNADSVEAKSTAQDAGIVASIVFVVVLLTACMMLTKLGRAKERLRELAMACPCSARFLHQEEDEGQEGDPCELSPHRSQRERLPHNQGSQAWT